MDNTLMSQAPASGQNMSAMPPQQPQAQQQPKLTPEKLQQLRSEGIQPATIVKFYGNLNPEFKQKYDAGASKGYNFSDASGKPISWDDAALNMEAYGNPMGQGAPQMQQGQPPAPSQGIMGKIGNAASTVWDYATAPIDATAGGIEYGMAKAAGAMGFKGVEQKQLQSNPDITGLKQNLQQTADIAPVVGATALSPFGAVGVGVGAFTGKAVGNLIETGIDMASGQPQRRGVLGKVVSPVAEGVLNYAGQRAFDAAIPAIKKGLTKAGAVLTNVADSTLERAFQKPQMMTTAIREISDNVQQPFLKLSQQIGNTLKDKIDKAGKAMGAAKDYILKNNPGATYDVSAAAGDLTDVLNKENITLNSVVKNGKLVITLVQGRAKPLSEDELAGITEYVKTISNAKDYSLNDVLDLKKLYNRIYKELGTNDIGTTSNAQRILRSIRTSVDGKISQAMPTDLANAYKDYSTAMGMHEDFGSFLTDNKGELELSDKAESYLNTLWGNTKGQRRQDIQALSDYLGIDISGKMQILKDAQELSSMFPKTGSRTLDILRSFISKGAATAGITGGAVTGGVPGAILGGAMGAGVTAATSPVIAGKIATKAGMIAGSRTFKAISGMLTKLAPAEKEALIMLITGGSQAIDKSINPPSQNQ